jgi:hypothetical protein
MKNQLIGIHTALDSVKKTLTASSTFLSDFWIKFRTNMTTKIYWRFVGFVKISPEYNTGLL